jgi:hypothetical protein
MVLSCQARRTLERLSCSCLMSRVGMQRTIFGPRAVPGGYLRLNPQCGEPRVIDRDGCRHEAVPLIPRTFTMT